MATVHSQTHGSYCSPRRWPRSWKWKWHSERPPLSDPGHPINRAIHLRKNVAYGERDPPPPRSSLRDDATAPEGKSFITWRPWFIFTLETEEFFVNEERIPERAMDDMENPVIKWWKERDDWPDGWKWRHESPSPEPEDLAPFNTGGMDFTPSELDALESIPPPSPELVKYGYRDMTPEWNFGGHFPIDFASAGPPQCTSSGATDEPEGQLLPDAQEQRPSPPPRRRGRPRKQSQPAGAAAAPPSPIVTTTAQCKNSGEECQSSTGTSTGNHPRNTDSPAKGDSSSNAIAHCTFGHGRPKEEPPSTADPRRRCHKISRTREQESETRSGSQAVAVAVSDGAVNGKGTGGAVGAGRGGAGRRL